MQGHKLKQSLNQIARRVKLPVVAQHYSNKRRVAVILRPVDPDNFLGYYVVSGEGPVQNQVFHGDRSEWILLASLHGEPE